MLTRGPNEVGLKEAASLLGCHYQTVRAYIQKGVIKARYPLGYGAGKPTWINLRELRRVKKLLQTGSIKAEAVQP